MKEDKALIKQGGKPDLEKLVINGDTYLTTLTKKFKDKQHWVKPDKKKVISFIPGTVRQVLVKVGDSVKEDDKLLMLEAMKMMNIINSPMAGKIKAILVKEGDRLPKGSVMIEFE